MCLAALIGAGRERREAAPGSAVTINYFLSQSLPDRPLRTTQTDFDAIAVERHEQPRQSVGVRDHYKH